MLAPDTVLQNRYLILRQLGQGGMGTIYQARDQRLGSVVVLKKTLGTKALMLQAFEREARLLANLRHARLPLVMDYFTEDDGHFLVMQFIPGKDLEELLQERQAPSRLTRSCAGPISCWKRWSICTGTSRPSFTATSNRRI
jgi:serine/threonine protein kinase